MPSLLQPLQSITVFPERYNERTHALTFLDNIERIRIVQHEEICGVVYYTMHVFFQRHINRIPTNKTTTIASNSEERTPDCIVTRRFSDFVALREAIWQECRTSRHGLVACRYCEELFNYIVFSDTQPNTMIKVFKRQPAHRMSVLEQFMNDMLTLGRACKSTETSRTCHGQLRIPTILYAFYQS